MTECLAIFGCLTALSDQPMLQQHELMQLRAPEKRPLDAYKAWVTKYRPFLGDSESLLDDEKDFVALKPGMDRDRLTRTTANAIGWFASVGGSELLW